MNLRRDAEAERLGIPLDKENNSEDEENDNLEDGQESLDNNHLDPDLIEPSSRLDCTTTNCNGASHEHNHWTKRSAE